MKIAVSTIAKNEAHNARAFVEACQEADLVAVLDTGSADDTVKLLREAGALVAEAEITPWRFDTARNKALDMLPDDIDLVVSIDLDERLQPGWRKPLEEVAARGANQINYRYTSAWRDPEQTQPIDYGWRTKVFAHKEFEWYRPVHEMPKRKDGQDPKLGYCEQMVVHQHQQGARDYAPLLSHVLADNPDDMDARQLRGAEHMRNQRWAEAKIDYERYLDLSRHYAQHPGHTAQGCTNCELLAGRRAYVRIDLARVAHRMGTIDDVMHQLLWATAEAPHLREAWVYLADGWRSIGNWPAAYGAAMTALNIVKPGINAQDMVCWGSMPREIADQARANIFGGDPAGPKRIGQALSDEQLATYAKSLVERIKDVEGDIIECGVCHGFSFTQLAHALYESGQDRLLYGLDSWDAMPMPGPEDASLLRAAGITDDLARFIGGPGAQGSPEEVRNRLRESGLPDAWVDAHVVLVPGYIEETLPQLDDRGFALIHLDVDTYAAYKFAIEQLWPRLEVDGVMAFDEYGDAWWPGCQRAVDEYLVQHPGAFKLTMTASWGHVCRYAAQRVKGETLEGEAETPHEEPARA